MVKLILRSTADSGPARDVPAGLQAMLNTAASAAAIELFAAYRVTITPTPEPDAQTPVPGLSALGIVRFSAPELSGTAVLGTSASILRKSNGRGTPDRDWIAELANQYIGRFKLKLLRAGFELWSMSPVALSGRLLATAVSQPQFAPMVFRDSQGGFVALWIDIDVNGSLKLAAPPSAGEIPTEGDVLLF